ncbi:MAG: corrinoid protein [archaeon]|nr:corrinoid protein [archaeon]
MSQREEILKRMADDVVVGEEEGVRKAAEDWAALVKEGKEKAFIGIVDGLAAGMKVVGDKYEAKEYFLPEVLLSADAMYAGLNVLLPLIPKTEKGAAGTIVLGVVEGDVHDIGKNIVKAMLTAAGYDVIDLGRDVPSKDFVQSAKEKEAQVIAMSTLMTPTLLSMKEVEDKLKEVGMKDKVRTIIGGGTVSEEWRKEIGSDAYGKDATEAVDKVKMLIDQIMVAVKAMKKREERETQS